MVLLHIPALIAYVTSEYAMQDAFQRRLNACSVLDELSKAVRGESHDVQKAVERCKGAVKCPGVLAVKTLYALHDALCKNTPPLKRPVNDTNETVDIDAWNAERSIVRELFGTQVRSAEGIKHILAFELDASGNSLAKCVRQYLEKLDATVTRAPLLLVCCFSSKKFIDYPFEFEFSGIKYALQIVGTPEKTMYEKPPAWCVDSEVLESMNALITKDACILVYRRF